jgi:hypothetical protein
VVDFSDFSLRSTSFEMTEKEFSDELLGGSANLKMLDSNTLRASRRRAATSPSRDFSVPGVDDLMAPLDKDAYSLLL